MGPAMFHNFLIMLAFLYINCTVLMTGFVIIPLMEATMLYSFFLAFAVLYIIFAVFLILLSIEVGITFFRKTAPQYPSQRKLRDAVIAEIRAHYPKATTAIDIGSGWGGMVRRVGKEFPKMQVVGVELMLLAFSYSWTMRLVFGPRNVKFIMGNAIEYIARSSGSDIAICYSGPPLMAAVKPLAGKFKVIISLDFPLPHRKATRTIKLHKDKLGQHMLYIYE